MTRSLHRAPEQPSKPPTATGRSAAARWFSRAALTVLGAALAFAGLTPTAPPAAAAVTCGPGTAGTMTIVAHTDDDLLFVSPDILRDLDARRCMRVVFTTAGEAGKPQTYWNSLEQGIRATYASMAGVANSWSQMDDGIAGRSIPAYQLAGAPVEIFFLRIPDGFPDGSGSSLYGGQSILKLWNGTTTSSVDGVNTYTKAQFQAVINELVTDFAPTTIRATDWTTYFDNPFDHSDHWATAQFANQAHLAYSSAHTFVGYETYLIDELSQNVTGNELTRKVEAFVLFADYDENVCNTPGEGCPDSPHDEWLKRQYYTASLHTGNVARNASTTVAASSQVSATQAAAKARDGYAQGSPVAATYEWASNGQGVGAWIEYTFPNPTSINGVQLFDRPNLTDQVTGGMLTFSDGSSVPVSELPNNGSARTITFAPKSVTSIRFTVGSVRSGTTNVGLSEFEVYNNMPFANLAPTANAGPDQDASGGAAVQLNGTGSSDPNGTPLSYAWTQTGGTSVTLTGDSTANPTFTAPNVTGPLTFRLVVGDGSLTSPADTVVVNVTEVQPNVPPTADAGAAFATSIGAAGVTLDGTGSSDPNGDTLTYAWNQTGGPAVTLASAGTATPSFTAPSTTGTLTFTVVVDDGRGGTDDDTVEVTVVPFADVLPGAAFEDDINWLYAEGITTGADGPGDTLLFGPHDSITREAMAAFIYRFMGSPAFTPPATSPFADMSPGDAFYKEITWLDSEGIEPGGASVDFSPTDLVTRELQAQWMFRALTTDAEAAAYTPSGTEPFTDVDSSHPSYTEISWMWDNNLSTGADIGGEIVYAPNDPISREAMAAFFYRAFTEGFQP